MKQPANPRRRACAIVAGLVLAAAASGCYRSAGFTYADVHTVGVKVVVNKTLYRNVDFELTDALRREVSALTFYGTDTPERADAAIETELTEYQERAETIDKDEQVTVRRIIVRAKYSLVENGSGTPLAGPKTARWDEIYRLRGDRSLAEARQDAVRKLAQRIVQDIFLPWPETEAKETD